MTKKQNPERFFDEEDFTSKHDQIFLWLLNNWQECMNFVFEAETQKAMRAAFQRPFHDIEHAEVIGEPVLAGYPTLFPDALIKIRCWKTTHLGYKFRVDHKIIVEIKPSIDSFGRVLRQLQLYRSRFSSLDSISSLLITLDTRFDNAFEFQGIFVFHPPVSDKDDAQGANK